MDIACFLGIRWDAARDILKERLGKKYGPLEAANNKLKLLQRRAFGDRDLDFFKLKILSRHNCRFELVG